jgi:tetracycline repressor-like protein
LREGMEQGILRETDEKVSSYAIIAMCTEVAGWFRPSGRLSVQQVIDIYVQMITEGLLTAKELAEKREESVHT